MEHTPGPWSYHGCLSASENSRGFIVTQPNKGFGIANVHPLDQDGREGEANARLIAAAPELLELAKAFCFWAASNDTGLDVKRIDSIIAKATGEVIMPPTNPTTA